MAKREIDFLVDPWGVLLGMWRRYKGTADGKPKPSEQRIRMWQQAMLYKYVDWKLDRIIEENPGEPEPLGVRASRQIEDEQWEELLSTANTLCKKFPSNVSGFRHACWALRRLKRLDEAEEVAKRTMRRFPLSYVGWEAYANCATDRGDFVQAERRWFDMREHFPEKAFSHTMHALALVKLGDIAAADDILGAATENFPDNNTLRREYAISAERMDDWGEAAERWLVGRSMFEREAIFHVRSALALLRLQDYETAEEVISGAEFIFPTTADVTAVRRRLEAVRGKANSAQG